ncbi:MAG TPA: hypothetical protein VHW23_47155 [Kofleriaceae bacterium]|nr:hypothetical protein [Kofleriaceae bacterium]
MRTLLLSLVLIGCSSSSNNNTDAGTTPGSDAAAGSDAGTSNLTCANYCSSIATACTGPNAQYGGQNAADVTAHCMSTCGAFNTSAAQSGATLGCHIQHTMNAAMSASAADVHCPHAGPAGDDIGTGSTPGGVCGDPCTNFCTIELAGCGLKGATGNTTGVYASMSDCMTACAAFPTTTPYKVDTTTLPSTTPTGDNLACRLYHATNAIISGSATVHCPHTAPDDTAKPNAACHN